MGQVFWVTGLSGSGKTTLSHALVSRMREDGDKVILLDGDEVRDALGGVFGYEAGDRERAAFVYARLSQLLSNQGVDVVVATISMFHSVRSWNREKINKYLEVYLESDRILLEARDSKGLYENRNNSKSSTMVGDDDTWQKPRNPDIVFTASNKLDLNRSVVKILENVKEI